MAVNIVHPANTNNKQGKPSALLSMAATTVGTATRTVQSALQAISTTPMILNAITANHAAADWLLVQSHSYTIHSVACASAVLPVKNVPRARIESRAGLKHT
jgi:hypothetical protein